MLFRNETNFLCAGIFQNEKADYNLSIQGCASTGRIQSVYRLLYKIVTKRIFSDFIENCIQAVYR